MENLYKTKLGAFIVPTGIGASIGGYAGDASGWARKFAEFSSLIVNPNVVNAGCFSGITKNMLYVEGYILDEFFKGNSGLIPSEKNKIGVVLDKGISQEVLNIHINTINAVKTVYDMDVIYQVTEQAVNVDFFVDESGISTGTVENIEALLPTAKALLEQGAEAIAVVCKFKDDSENEQYESGVGVDPIGGMEAIISHYLSKELMVPVAHSPAFEDFSIATHIVNPKASAEYITPTFLPCVLLGLNQAPQIAKMENGNEKIGNMELATASCHCEESCLQDDEAIQKSVHCLPFTVHQLDFLVMPYNALGSISVFEAIKRGIKVYAVKENQSVLNITKQALKLDGVVEVDTYRECLKLINQT